MLEKFKKRNLTIDILKCIAVLLVINSHLDICYVRFNMLATGGAIGDALFLFCSGFLFSINDDNFFTYIKKRLIRIYVPVIVINIIFGMVNSIRGGFHFNIYSLIGGEFVIALMIYSIVFYYIEKNYPNKRRVIITIIIVIISIAYIFFPYKSEVSERGIYGITTKFRWIMYSLIYYFGICIKNNIKKVKTNLIFDIIKFCISFFVFYFVQLVSKFYIEVAPFQIFTLIFLIGIIYYSYKIFSNVIILNNIYSIDLIINFVITVSNISFESYLIQWNFITNKLNFIFPINILIIIVEIIIVSYFINCINKSIINKLLNALVKLH